MASGAPNLSLSGTIDCQMLCAGLSLRTQELTALFLGIRLYCRCVLISRQARCRRLTNAGAC